MNTSTNIQRLFTNKLLKGLWSNFVKLIFFISTVCSSCTVSAQLVRSAAGPVAAAIQPAVDQFRVDLGGGTVPGANGSFGGIRREINWDAVPDALSAPNNLPPNLFNVNSPRGVVFETPGTGFQVSANAVNPFSAPIEFGNIDPSYTTLFASFSPQRLFTALGSNIMDIRFFVPGTNVPTVTKGFGAVFSDVDLANITSIQFFDQGNNSLGTFFVPPVPGLNESISFLGVSFPTAIISRVRITSGNVALNPGVNETSLNDLVVMDDFIYGEPVSLTTPQADLSITKTAAATVVVGSSITYTITVTNNGPDAAQNLAITDVLPAGVTFVSFSAPAGWTTSTPAVGSGGTVSANIASLANGTTAAFSLVVQLDAGVVAGTTINNTATVASTTTESNNGNNTATVTTTITASCPAITVNIPNALALPTGVQPNTVYQGYAPASSITLIAAISGGTPPYQFTWSNGSHSPTITVNPTTTTTYTVQVWDNNSCPSNIASITIQVVDVRGGKKGDKVVICHKPDKQANTLTIAASAVAAHLAHGDRLSSCSAATTTNNNQESKIQENIRWVSSPLSVQTFPNPSAQYFTINLIGVNNQGVQLRVIDMLGRIVEKRDNLPAHQTIKIGSTFAPGIYLVEIIQGSERKQLRLIKTAN